MNGTKKSLMKVALLVLVGAFVGYWGHSVWIEIAAPLLALLAGAAFHHDRCPKDGRWFGTNVVHNAEKQQNDLYCSHCGTHKRSEPIDYDPDMAKRWSHW